MEKNCKCIKQQIKLWGSIYPPSLLWYQVTTSFLFTLMYTIIYKTLPEQEMNKIHRDIKVSDHVSIM